MSKLCRYSSIVFAAGALMSTSVFAIDANQAERISQAYYDAEEALDASKVVSMMATVPGLPAPTVNNAKFAIEKGREVNGKRVSRKFVKVVPGKAPNMAQVLTETRFEKRGLAVERMQLFEEAPGKLKVVAHTQMPCKSDCEATYRLLDMQSQARKQ